MPELGLENLQHLLEHVRPTVLFHMVRSDHNHGVQHLDRDVSCSPAYLVSRRLQARGDAKFIGAAGGLFQWPSGR